LLNNKSKLAIRDEELFFHPILLTIFIPRLDNQIVLVKVLLIQIIKFVNIKQIHNTTLVIAMETLDALSTEINLVIRAEEMFLLFRMEIANRCIIVLRLGVDKAQNFFIARDYFTEDVDIKRELFYRL